MFEPATGPVKSARKFQLWSVLSLQGQSQSAMEFL